MARIIHRESAWKRFGRNEITKTILAMLGIEAVLQVFVTYKGYGLEYLPLNLMLMALTVFGCGIAFYLGADRILLLSVLLLLNIGFLVQGVQSEGLVAAAGSLVKFTVAILAAFLTAFLYSREWVVRLLADQRIGFGIMLLQDLICVVTFFFGKVIGAGSYQGATISLAGITPLELVKVSYLFLAASLLTGKNQDRGEKLLLLQTLVLSVLFALCGELGSLMIIYLVGLILLGVFSENRKLFWILLLFSLTGFLCLWILCDQVFYPMLKEGQLSCPALFRKLIVRFGAALHPEEAMMGDGYQATVGLQALTIGGLLGIGSERYRLNLPLAYNDYIFANVVETCGLLFGLLVIFLFYIFLKRGITIAMASREGYSQRLGIGITVMIVTEAIYHFGYTFALLPVCGIPLYFVSQGFLSLCLGLSMVSILLTLSVRLGDGPRLLEGGLSEDQSAEGKEGWENEE